MNKTAGIISIVFHPLLMPVYALAIIFSAPTLFGYIPFPLKRLLFLIVLVNNVLIPITLLPFLISRKVIGSWKLNERNDRIFPLIITTILYGATTFIIIRFPVPVFLKSYIISVTFLALLVTIINFWWKISIHSVGAGALIAVIMILSYKMYTPLLSYLIPSILTGGVILASRLELNIHDPLQVWTGFFAGFAGLFMVMMLF